MNPVGTDLKPIADIAEAAGLKPAELNPRGRYKTKVSLDALRTRSDQPDGKVILVTSINPTPPGEGKTVTTISLAQGLHSLGRRTIAALREPSMGPVFGLKGGATGGGRATVEPAVDINLHFTGDLHAITSANNLLAALIDDHLFRSRSPMLDVRRIDFHRVMDVNDRALRGMVVGLDSSVPRQARFDITAASEVMAILGLAKDHDDLRRRLERIVVGSTHDGAPVTAGELGAAGAMLALLRDALEPNLVQTVEGCPAFVHAGPFANIAHGTSSLVSLLLARKLAEYTVIEAGFGSDLGAEKFVNLVGAHGGPRPDLAVVVATVRALKYHGGVAIDDLSKPDPDAVSRGLVNLEHHVGIVRRLGLRPVIAINDFPTDTPEETDVIMKAASSWSVPAAVSRGFAQGGPGAEDLARLVIDAAESTSERAPAVPPVYNLDAAPTDKIASIAREIYGADGVEFSPAARRSLSWIKERGFGSLPICVAKTQYSLSDDPKRLGAPRGFALTVRDVEVRAGAGFLVALVGTMMTMPGLPPKPSALSIDVDNEGRITGVI